MQRQAMSSTRQRIGQSLDVTPHGKSPGPPGGAAALSADGSHNNETSATEEAQTSPHTEVTNFESLPDSPTAPTGVMSDQQEHQPEQQLGATARKLQTVKEQPEMRQRKVEPPCAAKRPQPGTAQVHLIGEVTGAWGLGPEPLYCTWQLVFDAGLWSVSRGQDKGRTHASSPLLHEDGSLSGVVWECPVDILLNTSSSQHWPSLVFKLFHRSVWLGRDEFVGYSLCSLPSTPGCHHISSPVWIATEGRCSLTQELTKWFTGLHPLLVNESFITDLEQRYEQGQHLHTVACSHSSSINAPSAVPCGYAMEPAGIAAVGAAAGGWGGIQRPFCPSFSTSGSGGTAAAGAAGTAAGAAAGGRICLRLHVLTRGMEQVSRVTVHGVESVGRCLERLHSSVGKLRRQQARQKLESQGLHDDDEESETQGAAEESEGLQLVREGRAARLAAAQRQLFSKEGDSRVKDRDQQEHLEQQHMSSAADTARPSSAVSDTVAETSSFSSSGRFGRLVGPRGQPSLAGVAAGDRAHLASTAVQQVGRAGLTLQGRGSAWVDSMAGTSSAAGAARPSASGSMNSPVSSSSPSRPSAASATGRWAGRFSGTWGAAPNASPESTAALLPERDSSSSSYVSPIRRPLGGSVAGMPGQSAGSPLGRTGGGPGPSASLQSLPRASEAAARGGLFVPRNQETS